MIAFKYEEKLDKKKSTKRLNNENQIKISFSLSLYLSFSPLKTRENGCLSLDVIFLNIRII